jgi:hypothetical protein
MTPRLWAGVAFALVTARSAAARHTWEGFYITDSQGK